MNKWLSEEEWKRYLATFSGADTESMWNAVYTMCDLFEDTAAEVADKSGFSYNTKEAESCRFYLDKVRHLPKSDISHIL